MIDLRIKDLPRQVNVGGRSFHIETDFRKWLDYGAERNKNIEEFDYFYSFIDDDEVPHPAMISELIEQLDAFYMNQNATPHDVPSGDGTRSIDYVLDGEYIYASFVHYYNIDLIDTEYMHWHKFKALLGNMKDTKINDIMGYRVYKKPSDKKDAYDNEMKSLRAMWTLPTEHTEEEKQAMKEFDDYWENK